LTRSSSASPAVNNRVWARQAELWNGGQSVHDGHVQVADDRIWALVAYPVECLLAIARQAGYPEAFVGGDQHHHNPLAGCVVVDAEYRVGHGRLSG